MVIFRASRNNSLKRWEFNFPETACADIHETSASTKLSQIERDPRTLMEQVLHDMVLGYVDLLFTVSNTVLLLGVWN